MADPSSLMFIFSNLQQIMGYVQIFVYIVLILFFGSIAAKGYRGYLSAPLKLLLRLSAGGLALVAGLSISNAIPFLQNTIVRLFGVDLIVGGIFSAIILSISLYLVSFGMKADALKKKIKKLEEKLGKMKPKQMKKMNPFSIAGIAVFVVFMVFVGLNFSGISRLTESPVSQLMPENIGDLIKNLCESGKPELTGSLNASADAQGLWPR